MNNEWFIIKDLDGLINSARALIFNNFGKKESIDDPDIASLSVPLHDQEELDKILSFEESKIIITNLAKKQKNKKSLSVRYLIDDEIFEKIVYSLNDRMVSNILNGLVNKGMVETAYDNEIDDFVFWVKDDVKNQIKKPETD